LIFGFGVGVVKT